MAFRPIVPDDVATIDPRVYADGPMGLAETLVPAGETQEARR
jgi:acyl CoA:acetate/3-ketoacid CoA transferase